jgi:hypothetical protein
MPTPTPRTAISAATATNVSGYVYQGRISANMTDDYPSQVAVVSIARLAATATFPAPARAVAESPPQMLKGRAANNRIVHRGRRVALSPGQKETTKRIPRLSLKPAPPRQRKASYDPRRTSQIVHTRTAFDAPDSRAGRMDDVPR